MGRLPWEAAADDWDWTEASESIDLSRSIHGAVTLDVLPVVGAVDFANSTLTLDFLSALLAPAVNDRVHWTTRAM